MYDIFACLPVDTSDLPSLDDIGGYPLATDLHQEGECKECHRAVWVGPRQHAAMQLVDRPYIILCYPCAALRVYAEGGLDAVDVLHIGGGPDVEGTVRS